MIVNDLKQSFKEDAIPAQRSVPLTTEEKAELVEMRDHATIPYLRERAAAILQVASGRSGRWVAHHGLLKQRQPDTVYGWLDRYETNGIEGLQMDEGRGRKASYDP